MMLLDLPETFLVRLKYVISIIPSDPDRTGVPYGTQQTPWL